MAQAAVDFVSDLSGIGVFQTSLSATTLPNVASPAGASGDLLIAMVVNDGRSVSGAARPIDTSHSTGNQINWTEIGDNTVAGPDDTGNSFFWVIEDQAASRTWTMGTLSPTAEQMSAVILRFDGHDGTTPVDVSETRFPLILMEGIRNFSVVSPGAMGVWALTADTTSTNVVDGPIGYTSQIANGGRNNARIEVETKQYLEADHPFPVLVPALTPDVDNNLVANVTHFIINPAVSTDTITGVTKDKDGNIIVSAEVNLLKDTGSGVYVYVATATSDGVTGAYSFTVTNDTDANFQVTANKTTQFGVTDNDLAAGDSDKDVFMFTEAQLPVTGGGNINPLNGMIVA